MSTLKIKTPLNVQVDVPHAGIGLRLGAFLVDIIIIIVYIYCVGHLFTSGVGYNPGDNSGENFGINEFLDILFTICLFPAIFYSLWTELVFNGQTPGKILFKIRVVKLDGYRARFTEYFTRWAFRIVDFWTGLFFLLFFIPIFGVETGYILSILLLFASGIVAVITIARTKNCQRWGDIVAGTTVLKLKEKQSIDITILEDIQESYIPTYPQVMKLSDNDARIIKDTFKSAQKNKDYATLKRLRRKLESVMEIESNQSDIQFIDTVLKDFNYYTQKM